MGRLRRSALIDRGVVNSSSTMTRSERVSIMAVVSRSGCRVYGGALRPQCSEWDCFCEAMLSSRLVP
jgi:hypothetical protein